MRKFFARRAARRAVARAVAYRAMPFIFWCPTRQSQLDFFARKVTARAA
jgi:hypothetical protein